MKQSSKLLNLAKKFLKQNGSGLTPRAKTSLFGGDHRLAKNVIFAATHPELMAAIEEGVITDHRVVEDLRRIGELATKIVLSLEIRLGRKLVRSKSSELSKRYLSKRACSLSDNDRQLDEITAHPAPDVVSEERDCVAQDYLRTRLLARCKSFMQHRNFCGVSQVSGR